MKKQIFKNRSTSKYFLLHVRLVQGTLGLNVYFRGLSLCWSYVMKDHSEAYGGWDL